MSSVIDSCEYKTLHEVFQEVRDTISRCACGGDRVNLYLWQSGVLVPLEMIEAEPEEFIEQNADPVWQWAPVPAVLGMHTDAATERATYSLIGVVLRGTLEARAVVAECAEGDVDPDEIHFAKQVGIRVNDANRAYILGSDGLHRG